jgi:hypothetical protein
MKRQTLAMTSDKGVEQYRRPTKRDVFLKTMDQIVPWQELACLIPPDAASWQPAVPCAETFSSLLLALSDLPPSGVPIAKTTAKAGIAIATHHGDGPVAQYRSFTTVSSWPTPAGHQSTGNGR